MIGHSDAPWPTGDSTPADAASQLMLGIGVELQAWEGGGQSVDETREKIGLLVRAARSLMMAGLGPDGP
jgi:hypothetical protein